eukprot:SAG31_NODE_1701_length_7496_cov_248.949169_5_plen_114_part_00
MAVHGWVPEFLTPPRQLAPPPEPQWNDLSFVNMETIVNEILAEEIVEPIPPPDFSSPLAHGPGAPRLCKFQSPPGGILSRRAPTSLLCVHTHIVSSIFPRTTERLILAWVRSN